MKPRIGIDPGLSGSIAVFENKQLKIFKMQEELQDIIEILKPYAQHPEDNECICSLEQLTSRPQKNAFITSRMQPMAINYHRIQDALKMLNIPYQLVSPKTWQSFHQLTLPRGYGEKGLDYNILKQLNSDIKHYKSHLFIETNVPNDVVIADNVKHILETSGKEEARKMLCDDFLNFSKYDLNMAIQEAEKEIQKFLNREKTIRKNRYKKRAQNILDGENYPKKVTLAEADAILLLLYQINNR